MLTLSEKIKIIAARQNMTIDELAKATNQTKQNLFYKFREKAIREKDLQKIADALGITVEIIFTLPDGTKI